MGPVPDNIILDVKDNDPQQSGVDAVEGQMQDPQPNAGSQGKYNYGTGSMNSNENKDKNNGTASMSSINSKAKINWYWRLLGLKGEAEYGSETDQAEAWKSQKDSVTNKLWLPHPRDVKVLRTDGTTESVEGLRARALKPGNWLKSVPKQLAALTVVKEVKPPPSGLGCIDMIRREINGDFFLDKREVQWMYIFRGFIILIHPAMVCCVARGLLPQDDNFKRVMFYVETTLSVLLYLDYVFGMFLGAVTIAAIAIVQNKLTKKAAKRFRKQSELWPIYARTVKGQTLWLCLVVALSRFVTEKGVLPWEDEDLRKAVSLGSKFFLAFHHMLAIGFIEQ